MRGGHYGIGNTISNIFLITPNRRTSRCSFSEGLRLNLRDREALPVEADKCFVSSPVQICSAVCYLN